ncbi:ROK family protein [Actinomarinicola tropica]|uniref:ROK family protein n=1 Tax=Actinomarinicola tropica TaxID=2789776 RepID=UPI0018988F13|nr:ROK family protein [Actinomarinicola tropica]
MAPPPTVGVDLGGTKIYAVALADGEVVATAKRSTPRTGGPSAVLERVAEAVERLGLDGPPHRIGIGGPGPSRAGRTTLGPAPNLAGWDDAVDLAPPLRERFGEDLVVVVDNDVNAAARAEAALGAGAGAPDLLTVFVGTGVGGGLVLDGRVRTGAHGMAGEIGHLLVVPDGEPCGCGGRGHVEAYAGRAGMERIARRRHDAGEPTALVDLAGEGRMRSSIWAEALASGDAMAAELVESAASHVGTALAQVALVVDVGLVAVGGGLAERLGASFLGAVEQRVHDLLPWDSDLHVVPTRLGDPAGAIGAALLAAEQP